MVFFREHYKKESSFSQKKSSDFEGSFIYCGYAISIESKSIKKHYFSINPIGQESGS
jgi:hypothetical protein